MSLLERRQEIRRLRGKGLPLNVIVNDLAPKYEVTPRAIYKDWKNRKHRIKALLSLGDPDAVFLDIVSRHNEIFRIAMVEYLSADNSSAKVGAIKLLRDLNRDLYDMNVTPDIMERLERIEELAKEKRSLVKHWG